MYCWGKAQEGALGVGGIEDLHVTTPKWNNYIGHQNVKSVGCGQAHTAILMDNGLLYSCGNNEFGQLGQEKGTMRPGHVEFLESIGDVKCGLYHTLILTSSGELFSCGDNSHGQLGLGEKETELHAKRIPRPVQLPSTRQAVQIACGGHHCLTLMQDGRVYSWGRNNHSQLGHSEGKPFVTIPTVVSGLDSIPISRIATGGAHSFGLTVCGYAFAWGRNRYGQLGITRTSVVSSPTMLASMDTCRKQIKYIACGEEHTVLLLENGAVLTCGSNQYGQLGRGVLGESYTRPAAVMDLMGSVVSQVACGKYHTVVVVKDSGRLFSFGQGTFGQLGTAAIGNSAVPVVVNGTWLHPDSLHDFTLGTPVDRGDIIRRIFAGGDQSFAVVVLPGITPIGPMCDLRMVCSAESPLFLSYKLIKQMLDFALITQNFQPTLDVLDMFLSSSSCINGSFLLSEPFAVEQVAGMNFPEIRESFDLIRTRLADHDIDKLICKAFSKSLIPSIPTPPPSLETLRVFCFIMCYPLVRDYSSCLEVLVPFIKVFLYITEIEKQIIANWIFNEPMDIVMMWIETFRVPIREIIKLGRQKLLEHGDYKAHINVILLTDDQTWALQEGIKVLRWLYNFNISRREPIHFQKFYVDELSECCDLRGDYICFKNDRVDCVVFMRYPFVLNAAAKAELMQADALFMKRQAVAQAHASNVMNYFFRVPGRFPTDDNPDACVLVIHRDAILPDALIGLTNHSDENLKKPLMVKFVDEDGVDWGGIRKEFFMLLIQEVLNPIYGMFYEDEESKLIWFKDQPMELFQPDLHYFNLVGMICGLAMYNGVNLDLPFPLVVYKKLLKRSALNTPTLNDLEMLKPSVGKHLRQLLEYEGDDFEKVYEDLRFEITKVHFGIPQTIPLVRNGSHIVVTRDNRQQYVQAYVDYELTLSIKDQFDAFADGFKRVCNTQCEIYTILHAEELMLFVIGSGNYDFNSLREHTEYYNGYDSDHRVIIHFWKIVNEFSLEVKKKLLVFWTGSNRIPLAGLKSMKLRIQRMDGGANFIRLPVAHTCANVLDLPPYPTLELMREKLLKAINLTSGFGII